MDPSLGMGCLPRGPGAGSGQHPRRTFPSKFTWLFWGQAPTLALASYMSPGATRFTCLTLSFPIFKKKEMVRVWITKDWIPCQDSDEIRLSRSSSHPGLASFSASGLGESGAPAQSHGCLQVTAILYGRAHLAIQAWAGEVLQSGGWEEDRGHSILGVISVPGNDHP